MSAWMLVYGGVVRGVIMNGDSMARRLIEVEQLKHLSIRACLTSRAPRGIGKDVFSGFWSIEHSAIGSLHIFLVRYTLRCS